MKSEFSSNIKKIVFAFVIFETILCAFFYTRTIENKEEAIRADIVAINEVVQMQKQGQSQQQIQQKLDKVSEHLLQFSKEKQEVQHKKWIIAVYCSSLIFIAILFFYIYYSVIRPFQKLNYFAQQISKGDFSIPLEYERNNMFGSFTWAFDNMRKEITKARKCEQEAIENNKTVIATISHDIKTPIASIRAYSEALEAGMDHNPERKQRYLQVIMKKCDEVSQLTNDLFLHSLSDLEKLKMNLELVEADQLVGDILDILIQTKEHITMKNQVPKVRINVDPKRMAQVYENILGNAEKYAKSDIEITHYEEGDYLVAEIRDFGPGILDEDLPFVFDQFYRGKNVSYLPGAGLGLYIVSYIMEQMDGKVEITNANPGLLVKIYFLKTS